MEILNQNIPLAIKKMYEEKLFSDVSFKIGDLKFDAHKSYLSSCNEYFKSLLSEKFKESSQKEILIKEISPQFFQYILEYLYLGKIIIKPGDLLELHFQASFFLV